MIDRVHNPPYPPPNGLPSTTQQQEYLKSQLTQPFDYVRRIIDLETRVSQLEAALKRMLLEYDFMVEAGLIPDVRNDVIFVEARAALAKMEESK